MRTSDAVDLLVAALAKARADFKPIVKRSENPHFRSKYADLTEIVEAVSDALAAQGLIVTGGPEPSDDGRLLVCTRLIHTSGQWLENSMLLERDKIQQLGSGITYARRYTMAALLGVAAEDDGDGEAAQRSSGSRHRGAVQDSPVDGPSPHAVDGHPTAAHIDSLMELAQAAESKEALGRNVRRMLGLHPETRLTKKFLREHLTMAQYDALCQQYQQAITVSVEADVEDFTPPSQNAPESTKPGQSIGGIAPTVDRATTGPESAENAHAMADMAMWTRLSLRALRVGIDKAAWEHLRSGAYADALDVVESAEEARQC